MTKKISRLMCNLGFTGEHRNLKFLTKMSHFFTQNMEHYTVSESPSHKTLNERSVKNWQFDMNTWLHHQINHAI